MQPSETIIGSWRGLAIVAILFSSLQQAQLGIAAPLPAPQYIQTDIGVAPEASRRSEDARFSDLRGKEEQLEHDFRELKETTQRGLDLSKTQIDGQNNRIGDLNIFIGGLALFLAVLGVVAALFAYWTIGPTARLPTIGFSSTVKNCVPTCGSSTTRLRA